MFSLVGSWRNTPRITPMAHLTVGPRNPTTPRDSYAFVFASPEGTPLQIHNFRHRVWQPAVRKAGFTGLRVHDLRHTCASLAIAAGADVKVLQDVLGHASAAMTLDHYGKLLPGRSEQVADRLDALHRGTA